MKYTHKTEKPARKKAEGNPFRSSAKIAGVYFIVGCLWVLFSHEMIADTMLNPGMIYIDIVNGWIYVLLSGLLVLLLVHSAFKKQKNIQNELNKSVSELAESENFRKTITEKMLNAYVLHKVVTDTNGKPVSFEYVDANTAFETFIGRTKEEILGKPYQDILPKRQSEQTDWLDIFSKVALTGEPVSVLGYTESFEKWISINVYMPQKGYVAAVFDDITEMKNREAELEEKNNKLAFLYEALTASEDELRQRYEELSSCQKQAKVSDERYKLAIEGSNDIIWDIDIVKNQFYISGRSLELLGYDKTNYNKYRRQYRFWRDLIKPEDLLVLDHSTEDYLSGNTSVFSCEIRFLCKNSEYKWFHVRGKALTDSHGAVIRFAGSISDIDQRKRNELQLKKNYWELETTYKKLNATQDELQKKYNELKVYQEKLHAFAYFDSLTNLPNRLALNERLPHQLKESPTKNLALLFIDSDNFKFINDTMGHSFGDEFIIEVGKKLKALSEDPNTVFRLGGDEFIIVYNGFARIEQVKEFAGGILQSFVEPVAVGASSLYSTVSIGISVYPRDGADLDTLMKNADIAMYKAKELGKNKYVLYNPEMNKTVKKRMLIEKHLRGALPNNEFLLYYQPQLDIETGRIIGFEALLRWSNPVLGFMSPLKFIGIAEETHLIIGIGEWVLREACRFLTRLHQNGYPDLMISVNISIIQLVQDSFLDMVLQILEELGLPPQYLELEITESVLMESFQTTGRKLQQLKKRGIRIALDDFGQGYSSLSYLRQLPIDTLKIDKTFIDSINEENGSQSLAGTIVALGRSMGLSIIAEGVSTPEQADYLIRHNCHMIQGFLFSAPLPQNKTEELLSNWDWKTAVMR